MARLFDIFLDINRTIAEGLLGFSAGTFKLFGKRRRIVHDAHTFTATAGDGFDDDREAD